MSDAEWKARLRAAPTPEWPERYWEEFPERVLGALPRQRMEAPGHGSWFAPVAWGSALACACVALGFGIGLANRVDVAQLFRQERQWRERVETAPKQVCLMLQPGHSLRGLVAEAP